MLALSPERRVTPSRHRASRPADNNMTDEQNSAEILDLMATFVTVRHSELRHRLAKVVDRASMLHVDALIMVYHLAKIATGHILEVGSFFGGATIAAAYGVRASGTPKKIVTIEPGGPVKHHRLPSKDIFKDLEKNLSRFGVADEVTVLHGHSFDPAVIAAVKQTFAPGDVGLFIFDADNNVRRDLDSYGELLSNGCWVVIDDYVRGAEDKVGPTRSQVDELIAEGRLVPLGYYGWGTWVGKWRRP